jgi:uncharacterized protein (DUF1330 family)
VPFNRANGSFFYCFICKEEAPLNTKTITESKGNDMNNIMMIGLLEGEWPHKGSLMLYKCSSMQALLDFWNSAEYQQAMKLRAGIVESNFTVAIEATG